MKNRKFNLNWQSVMLGVVLCVILALAVFITSKPASAQVGGRERIMQRTANMNDLWEKTNALEANIVAMNEQLNRIEVKIDNLNRDMAKVLRAIK